MRLFSWRVANLPAVGPLADEGVAPVQCNIAMLMVVRDIRVDVYNT